MHYVTYNENLKYSQIRIQLRLANLLACFQPYLGFQCTHDIQPIQIITVQ